MSDGRSPATAGPETLASVAAAVEPGRLCIRMSRTSRTTPPATMMTSGRERRSQCEEVRNRQREPAVDRDGGAASAFITTTR